MIPIRICVPQRMQDMIGQRDVCERLRIAIDAARKRGEALGHVLFDGPPGLGKTTFAICIPNELGVSVQLASGAVLKAPKDLVPYLTNAEERSVLFIDEIHRLPQRRGGVPVHGDGGFPHRHRVGRRGQCPHAQSVAQAVHADWRHDAGRHAVGPAARPVPDPRAPGILLGGRIDHVGRCRNARKLSVPIDQDAVPRDRRAQPFDATRGQQPLAAGCATTPRAGADGRHHAAVAHEALGDGGHRHGGTGHPGPSLLGHAHSRVSRRLRPAWRPSPTR